MLIITIILFIASMGSAIGIVYSKHKTRKTFSSLQRLHKDIDELNIEWGKLQLEQSAWSSHGRIEKIARKKLKMIMPKTDEIVYIKQ